jgi:hypothetical protein
MTVFLNLQITLNENGAAQILQSDGEVPLSHILDLNFYKWFAWNLTL